MGTEESWWARQDLNLGPTDYESAALTAELQARRVISPDFILFSGECIKDSEVLKLLIVVKL
jgi:hypothetical protein